jgi:hypothetical protein
VASIIVWEASGRISGKWLKTIIPILVRVVANPGYFGLAPEIRAALLTARASTIDRLLQPQCEQTGTSTYRCRSPSALRRSTPRGHSRT